LSSQFCFIVNDKKHCCNTMDDVNDTLGEIILNFEVILEKEAHYIELYNVHFLKSKKVIEMSVDVKSNKNYGLFFEEDVLYIDCKWFSHSDINNLFNSLYNDLDKDGASDNDEIDKDFWFWIDDDVEL